MDLCNKKKHVKTDLDTDSNKIYALLDEVIEEDDIDNLLNNTDTEYVLENFFKNDILPDEQSNKYVLMLEANIHLPEENFRIV